MKEYINKHTGKKFYVFGLGPSLQDVREVESDSIRIGVNDILKHFKTDYIVCIDRMRSFSPERFTMIYNNTVPMFTHLSERDLPYKGKRVNIELQEHRGEFFSIEKFAISYCSPFVAMQVAAKMGASEIVVCGVDLNNHKLNTRMRDMRYHFDELRQKLESQGIKVTSMSDPEGALKNYPRK